MYIIRYLYPWPHTKALPCVELYETYEGRGQGAEISHTHQPGHFKSACYGTACK